MLENLRTREASSSRDELRRRRLTVAPSDVARHAGSSRTDESADWQISDLRHLLTQRAAWPPTIPGTWRARSSDLDHSIDTGVHQREWPDFKGCRSRATGNA
ncbi:MAG: hypothetical protein ABI298_09110 [Acidimicrobiales bacterium]